MLCLLAVFVFLMDDVEVLAFLMAANDLNLMLSRSFIAYGYSVGERIVWII